MSLGTAYEQQIELREALYEIETLRVKLAIASEYLTLVGNGDYANLEDASEGCNQGLREIASLDQESNSD